MRSISVSDARDAFASQPKTCGGDHDGASTSAAIAAGRTRGRFSRRPVGTWRDLGGEDTWRVLRGAEDTWQILRGVDDTWRVSPPPVMCARALTLPERQTGRHDLT